MLVQTPLLSTLALRVVLKAYLLPLQVLPRTLPSPSPNHLAFRPCSLGNVTYSKKQETRLSCLPSPVCPFLTSNFPTDMALLSPPKYERVCSLNSESQFEGLQITSEAVVEKVFQPSQVVTQTTPFLLALLLGGRKKEEANNSLNLSVTKAARSSSDNSCTRSSSCKTCQTCSQKFFKSSSTTYFSHEPFSPNAQKFASPTKAREHTSARIRPK